MESTRMAAGAMFSPSDGFVELVSRTHKPESEYFDLNRPIPTKPEELWKGFLFPMFVGGRRRAAQVNYAVKTLEEFLSLGQGRRAQTDADWTRKVKARIQNTIVGLGKSPPEGLKRSILEDILGEMEDAKLASMAAGMTEFIDNLDPGVMLKVRGDFNREFEFVVNAVGNGAMPHVGYTRFVIWIQYCNSGWTLTPPSGPARWAIDSADLGFKGNRSRSWEESDASWDLGLGNFGEFGQLCTKYNNLTQLLRTRIDSTLTPMEVQSVAWVLGATHGLLLGDTKARAKYSARALLSYLDSRSWGLAEFEREINDIDRCLPLIQDFKTRL